MIVDTSAVVAIMIKEPGWRDLSAKMALAPIRGMGTPTLVETGIVLSARAGKDMRPMLVYTLRRLDIEEVPFGEEHWREAVSAWLRFGKGRHPASLNLGDCMSYATARLANQPLLFVGDDFSRTDIQPA